MCAGEGRLHECTPGQAHYSRGRVVAQFEHRQQNPTPPGVPARWTRRLHLDSGGCSVLRHLSNGGVNLLPKESRASLDTGKLAPSTPCTLSPSLFHHATIGIWHGGNVRMGGCSVRKLPRSLTFTVWRSYLVTSSSTAIATTVAIFKLQQSGIQAVPRRRRIKELHGIKQQASCDVWCQILCSSCLPFPEREHEWGTAWHAKAQWVVCSPPPTWSRKPLRARRWRYQCCTYMVCCMHHGCVKRTSRLFCESLGQLMADALPQGLYRYHVVMCAPCNVHEALVRELSRGST